MEVKTKEISNEIEALNDLLIHEKRSKVMFQEELLRIYIEHENLLVSYQRLESKYQAISHSKLGKLTYRYWKLLKRVKRGNKNENN
ncbi:hypothetical protein ACWV26_09110 [Rummeliibacillus sp. JY-2-4R]